MANKRTIKREVNNVLGDLITKVYSWENRNPGADRKNSEAIIDAAIVTFDDLIERINQSEIEKPKEHFKMIQKELAQKSLDLSEKIASL